MQYPLTLHLGGNTALGSYLYWNLCGMEGVLLKWSSIGTMAEESLIDGAKLANIRLSRVGGLL